MTGVSINWDDKEFKKNLKKLEKAFTTPSSSSAVGRSVILGANRLLEDSQEIVPFDTGDLQKSGSVGKVHRDGKDIAVDVGFNKKYASKVHEDMTLKISQKRGSTSGKARQQKYLELPMKQNKEDYARIIASTILKSL